MMSPKSHKYLVPDIKFCSLNSQWFCQNVPQELSIFVPYIKIPRENSVYWEKFWQFLSIKVGRKFDFSLNWGKM